MSLIIRLGSAACVAVMLFALGACGEVESCERLELGCVDGPVDPLTQRCKFGLVNVQGTCVDPKNVVDSGGMKPGDCNCPQGQLCRTGGGCVDACQLPDNLPVKKIEPGSCRPVTVGTQTEPPYDYATALQRACQQDCIRRQEYCGTPCDMNACAVGGARIAQVQTGSTCSAGDTECMMRFCEGIRDLPCTSFQCGGSAPNCAGIACSNGCPGFPQFANDGVCDDGDLSNGTSAVCAWGTDCGDCGPRRGVAPNMNLDYGDLCVDPTQCGGDLDDVNRATGWCVRFDLSNLSVLRCVPDCSLGKGCRAGFDCKELVYFDENGNQTTLTDSANKKASACFPMMCGGSAGP